jgi:hypothetical protein
LAQAPRAAAAAITAVNDRRRKIDFMMANPYKYLETSF